VQVKPLAIMKEGEPGAPGSPFWLAGVQMR